MPSPRIVKEVKRTIKTAPPPIHFKLEDINVSEWDWYEEPVELYISTRCMEKMIKHCVEHAEEGLEVMGLLIGDIYEWDGIIYTVAEDAVTTELDATHTSVKFKSEAMTELAKILDEIPYDYILVGWYHSHPGFTCFLSEKDIETQERIFSKFYHCHIVIDPINKEFRSFKVIDGEYVERRFEVFISEKKVSEITPEQHKEILDYIDMLIKKQLKKGYRSPVVDLSDAKKNKKDEGMKNEVESDEFDIDEDIMKIIEKQKRIEE